MQTLMFRGFGGPIYDPLAGDACDGAGHGTAGLHSRREPGDFMGGVGNPNDFGMGYFSHDLNPKIIGILWGMWPRKWENDGWSLQPIFADDLGFSTLVFRKFDHRSAVPVSLARNSGTMESGCGSKLWGIEELSWTKHLQKLFRVA